ncbi:MAG: 30S ribosomal protein S16 [Candidatus Yanofskybacteria bacterium]|nr:30S ribosomal protein S16 [Candidatus Yanofskybacteria bacterium]
MLKIRLQRIGKRGQAYFKLIVTEHTQKPKGQYLELLGSYDPHKNEMNVDTEKVKHWLSQGAKMSETVNNLLVGKGVIQGEKVTVWKPKNKKGGEATGAGETKPASTPKQQVEMKPKTEEPKEEIKAEETAQAQTETSVQSNP